MCETVLSFSIEFHLLPLFSQIGIKSQFPLKSPITYYRYIIA